MAGQRQSSLLDVDNAQVAQVIRRSISLMTVKSNEQLMRKCIRVANAAKRYCPVDNGRLRSAIDAQPAESGGGPVIDVGVLFDPPQTKPGQGRPTQYGVFVEYGTSRMRAQPFMRPALAEEFGVSGVFTIAGQGGRQLHTRAQIDAIRASWAGILGSTSTGRKAA